MEYTIGTAKVESKVKFFSQSRTFVGYMVVMEYGTEIWREYAVSDGKKPVIGNRLNYNEALADAEALVKSHISVSNFA